MLISASGIGVDLPRGWDGSIFTGGIDGGSAALRRELRTPGADEAAATVAATRTAPTSGSAGHAVMHASTFALPAQRGDFGSGAVDRMAGEDVFVALLEFHPDAARTPLFASNRGLPASVSAGDYKPDQLQRTLAGQAGVQRFFTVADRAFCLYVVLGAHSRRAALAPRVDQVLASTTIGPR